MAKTRGDLNGLLVANAGHARCDRESEYLVARGLPCGRPNVELVEVAQVTHFYAKDKLTFAVTAAKHHALDLSIVPNWKEKLLPGRWIRIHRLHATEPGCGKGTLHLVRR